MGATQSTNTRTITVSNEDPTSVIKVSDTVVKRLRGGNEGKEDRTQSQPVSPPQSKDKQAALKENDEYWGSRVKILEENHKKINQRMEDEYKKAVKEVGELFARLPSKEEQAPCSYAGQYVKKCYQQNPKEVLKCAREVEAFAACVDMKRVNLLHCRHNMP